MIIDHFEIWRIAIGNERSECLTAWEQQGFTVNTFAAITPDTMPDDLIFDKKRRSHTDKNPIVDFTETEKAIWYSHYALWEQCDRGNKPYVIIEADVVPTEQFPLTWEVDTLKYFCKSATTDRYSSKVKYTPAAGYILTPKGAATLITFAHHRPIIANVDAAINQCRDPNPDHTRGGWAKQYAKQTHHENKTIEHL